MPGETTARPASLEDKHTLYGSIMRRSSCLALFLLAPTSALALPEPCTSATDPGALASTLEQSESALGSGELDAARDHLRAVHRDLLCLDETVDPALLGRLGHQLAVAFFFDQDEIAMHRWLRSARSSAGADWPDFIPEDHPMRAGAEDVELHYAGPQLGYLAPKKGGVFLQGAFSATPTAPVETPVFVQVADRKGRVVQAWWQDGAAFPEDTLAEDSGPLRPPKWWTPPSDASAPSVSKEVVEPMPTPAVAAEQPPVVPAAEVVEPTGYVDPFSDANRRRVLREKSERRSTNAQGDTLVVSTEIVSFVPDPSEGRPVTHGHFEQWLKDMPDWQASAARSAGRADATYLDGWDGHRHPQGTRKLPVINVSFEAARAYCLDFNSDLIAAGERPTDQQAWEFRLDGEAPVRVSTSGKVKPVRDTAQSFSDTGFRCRF